MSAGKNGKIKKKNVFQEIRYGPQWLHTLGIALQRNTGRLMSVKHNDTLKRHRGQ
jgi:hypothetical protein